MLTEKVLCRVGFSFPGPPLCPHRQPDCQRSTAENHREHIKMCTFIHWNVCANGKIEPSNVTLLSENYFKIYMQLTCVWALQSGSSLSNMAFYIFWLCSIKQNLKKEKKSYVCIWFKAVLCHMMCFFFMSHVISSVFLSLNHEMHFQIFIFLELSSDICKNYIFLPHFHRQNT